MKDLDSITERFKNLDEKLTKKDKNEKKKDFKENILESIKVEDIVEKPEVVDIHTSVEEVINIMSDNNSSEILVSTKDEIVGVITLSKLLGSFRQRKDIANLEAESIMEEIMRINKKDTLSKAILVMNIHNLPGLVVFDNDNMLGMVTKSSILKKISKLIFTKETGKVSEKPIETKVDELIDLLGKEKEVSMEDLKSKLNMDEEIIEEWLRILEKQKVINIEKSRFGKLKVKVKNVG